MPVDPTSRFADLPLLAATAPDGSRRNVVALRTPRQPTGPPSARHVLREGEGIDLVARRLFGDEGLWWRLLDANPLVHPFDLQPADVLDVPGAGPATQAIRARTF